MDRHEFTVRRLTNQKKTTVWERLHKVHNYHWYTQYQMALEPISDISSDEEEDNCLDQKSIDTSEEESSEDEGSEEESSEDETLNIYLYFFNMYYSTALYVLCKILTK